MGKVRKLGRAAAGQLCLTVCLSLLPICVCHSSAPKGCTSFGINASPGVVVDVAHSFPAKKNPSGFSKWPLDPGLEVSLRMRAASSSTSDQKVSTAAVAWEEDSRSQQVSIKVCPALTHSPNPFRAPFSLEKLMMAQSRHSILRDNIETPEVYAGI